jgi:hypothetical protein
MLPATPEGMRASASCYFMLGALGSMACLVAFQWLERRSALYAHYAHHTERQRTLRAEAEVELVESEPLRLRAGPLSADTVAMMHTKEARAVSRLGALQAKVWGPAIR